MNKKVSVIGIGRLGLSFALLLDSKGYDVVGCDVNVSYVQMLKDKTFNSPEPLINEMLSTSKMSFTTYTVNAFNHADIIFVLVQTPSKEGGEYNHKYIDQIVDKLIDNEVKDKTLVISSTVMPQYCQKVQNKLEHLNINVVYNPEFIAQGSIVAGLKNADVVLVGTKDGKEPSLFFESIYMDIMNPSPPNFKVLSLTGAEITKMAINCFLTLKIGFANMIGEIIISSWEEENIEQIMDAIGSDSRIGKKYLNYGFPAGGVCLPRDQKALNSYAAYKWVHTDFLNDIDKENNRHLEWMVRHYKNKNQDKSVPFTFSYLGYKKGVDILTESYQLKLCIELLREGYKVVVPDHIKYSTDTPEEFRDYVYRDKVIFGETEGYKIN